MSHIQPQTLPSQVLTAATIDSESLPAATCQLEELAGYIQNGWIVLWQHHRVFVISVMGGKFEDPIGMEEDQALYMQRARAFNADREWHVWRTKSGLQGRKRSDEGNAGSSIESVDALMPLRGVIVHQLGDRKAKETWVLRTRSYIDYNAFHHAGFVDSRFLAITKVGKETKQ